MDKATYKLNQLPKLRTRLVFHVSMLKSYYKDPKDPIRGEHQRPPMGTKVSYNKIVEKILVEPVLR